MKDCLVSIRFALMSVLIHSPLNLKRLALNYLTLKTKKPLLNKLFCGFNKNCTYICINKTLRTYGYQGPVLNYSALEL